MAKATENARGGNGKPLNKSAAIREVIEQHPQARSQEIVSLLAQKGIKVRPTLVYYIRSKQNQEKRKQRRQHVAETSRNTGTGNPVELVLKTKSLAREAGGIRYLKQLVDALAE
jgi:hypothetical protein